MFKCVDTFVLDCGLAAKNVKYLDLDTPAPMASNNTVPNDYFSAVTFSLCRCSCVAVVVDSLRNFDFCACLGKYVIERDAGGKKGMLSCCKCFSKWIGKNLVHIQTMVVCSALRS